MGSQIQEQLKQRFENDGTPDFLVVDDGNTYALRFALHATGADEIISEMVLNKGILYVGGSASAINAGETMLMALWKDGDGPNGELSRMCIYHIPKFLSRTDPTKAGRGRATLWPVMREWSSDMKLANGI